MKKMVKSDLSANQVVAETKILVIFNGSACF
ncbi:hypothetical protein EV586_105110 [Tumebacillus sp. BK434]|nr:hypothetical protein EV586_105110 [Tumebacillus sp. BK434]